MIMRPTAIWMMIVAFPLLIHGCKSSDTVPQSPPQTHEVAAQESNLRFPFTVSCDPKRNANQFQAQMPAAPDKELFHRFRLNGATRAAVLAAWPIEQNSTRGTVELLQMVPPPPDPENFDAATCMILLRLQVPAADDQVLPVAATELFETQAHFFGPTAFRTFQRSEMEEIVLARKDIAVQASEEGLAFKQIDSATKRFPGSQAGNTAALEFQKSFFPGAPF